MIEHVAAIRAALTAAGIVNYFVSAPDAPTYPYALVWTSNGAPPVEEAVAPGSVFEDLMGVTTVAGSPEGVLTVRKRVRTALAGFAPSAAVPGRLVWLKMYDSRAVLIDRDVTVTGTGKHPAYGVDMYRLVSVPA